MGRYFLQTDPGLLIILVRHGKTALNNPSDPLVRGWVDAELSGAGRLDVQMAAQKMKKYAPQAIVSSDFMRDTQTAQLLAARIGIASVETDFNSRTWDVGLYGGRPESEVQQAINTLYERTWEAPPGSNESFDQFSERWFSFLDRQIELARNIPSMRPMIIVTHGRNIALTDSKYNFKLPNKGMMPYPAGYALLAVGEDRGVDFAISPPDECVCSDL